MLLNINKKIYAKCLAKTHPIIGTFSTYVTFFLFSIQTSLLYLSNSLPFVGFPHGSVVKESLPANAGEEVQSLGQEDALEKEMAILSTILAW